MLSIQNDKYLPSIKVIQSFSDAKIQEIISVETEVRDSNVLNDVFTQLRNEKHLESKSRKETDSVNLASSYRSYGNDSGLSASVTEPTAKYFLRSRIGKAGKVGSTKVEEFAIPLATPENLDIFVTGTDGDVDSTEKGVLNESAGIVRRDEEKTDDGNDSFQPTWTPKRNVQGKARPVKMATHTTTPKPKPTIRSKKLITDIAETDAPSNKGLMFRKALKASGNPES